MRFPRHFFVLVTPLVLLLILPGCEDEAPVAKRKPILGKTTQEIRRVEPEVQKKEGAQIIEKPRIVAKDPILLQGNAYVSIVSRAAQLNIEHAIDLYKAANDNKYPANYEEFITKIIKENNIALPQLPHYQEYGYDEQQHKLIIIEYPAKKDS